jgi:plasmid stability protein
MSAEIIQVRDVPSEDVDALRSRAAARGMSLSAYLRELIHEDVSRPSMTEIVARIATRDSVEADSADIRAFIDDGRR